MDSPYAADLELVLACMRGDRAALATLDERLLHEARAVAHMHGTVSADEVVQTVRTKLLVSEQGKPSKIHQYTGRGPLAAWLRVIVVREYVDAIRKMRSDYKDVGAEETASAPTGDPELSFLRHEYHDEFARCFREALATLSVMDRNLLRFAVVDGLTIDEIAPLFSVHRATVARRLSRVKDDVFTVTRRLFAARVNLEARDLDSVMALLMSRADVSIGLLQETDHDGTLPESTTHASG